MVYMSERSTPVTGQGVHPMAESDFQPDALSSSSDWLIFNKHQFDWLGVPSNEH